MVDNSLLWSVYDHKLNLLEWEMYLTLRKYSANYSWLTTAVAFSEIKFQKDMCPKGTSWMTHCTKL